VITGANPLLLIRLAARACRIFKILYQKQKLSEMYRALLKQENLLRRIRVDATKILDRIEVSELSIDEALMDAERIALPESATDPTRRRVPFLVLTAFVISLAAYTEKVTGTCPLCAHGEDVEVSDEEEERD
jgi:hypothetical protein